MAVFTEKPPVTSSNCYETMKNASILIKLGTNVNWTTRGHLKIAKNHYFASIFSIKFIQSATTSQGIEIESKAFQLWLHVTL
jgi:hypothetical protein